MFSKIPYDLQNLSEKNIDRQLLRAAIVAELDAINLYEQMAEKTRNDRMRKIFMDVAKEEKTHMGEFYSLLVLHDTEQIREMEKGRKEVQEIRITGFLSSREEKKNGKK